MPALIFVVKGGKALGMNGPARELLGAGFRETETKGGGFTGIFDPKSRRGVRAMLDKLEAGLTPAALSCTLVPARGEKIHGILAVELVADTMAVMSMVTDSDVPVHAKSELQRMNKLESLGLLAGGLAHDFNNMLTGILGNINLALRYSDPRTSIYDRLVEAEKASLLAKNLTEKLLIFARGGTPQKKAVPVDNLILENVCILETGSSISWRCTFPPGLWPVEINEGQIIQVMTNLLINAKQAMEGKGEIRVTAENTVVDPESGLPLERGRYVKIAFSDAGTGIDKEILPQIFDPYFSTRPSGTGLGLAIAYSIIRQHRGYITVESRKGKGTTFHIFLPAAQGRAPSP